MLVRSPLLTSHKWRELVSSGRFVCRCHVVFCLVLRLFCFASFFRLYDLVEAAALRSIVLRYAGVSIATHVSIFFIHFFIWRCRFFRVFFPLSLCMDYRVRRTFFPSGWRFFYRVTTGWIFYTSLCEKSINQSIKRRVGYFLLYLRH